LDGYPGTFITEVGAAFVSGPGRIEGAVMGEDLEGNHFQVMEDAHQDMKDVIVSFFSDALAEVGKGSFGGDVFNNTGIVPIFTPSFLIPKHRQKGVHVRVVVNIPEQVQEKECRRVIAGRAEDAIGINRQRPDKGKVNQGCDHTCISALYIPSGIDRNEAFPEDILRQEFGLWKKFLMESRKILVDLIEIFRYVWQGKFVNGVHIYLTTRAEGATSARVT
jgi:hypothetical protein